MPMTADFNSRLMPILNKTADHFGTPFHIYDEIGIRRTGESVKKTFSGIPGFQEFFAVKALPNTTILRIMRNMGFGFDCSSEAELAMCRGIGATGDALMFTSNNTTTAEFQTALDDGGSILNLDDISLLDKLPKMPDMLSFRYNPGERRSGNAIIGIPSEAKYGVSHRQINQAYRIAGDRGARKFGLHTMLISNERDYTHMVKTAAMLLELASEIADESNIRFDFINIGGGLGIPYHPTEDALNLSALGDEVTALFKKFQGKHRYMPRLYMESGRYMTGPHGALVTRAINRKEIYRTHVGVDAGMSSLMRPAIYGAYHHVTVAGKDLEGETECVDVVGSLCENNDKFAVQRILPKIDTGDLVVIHDTGAHGHSMGFTYNGRLRSRELLLRADGRVELIRRAETLADYFATLAFDADVFSP